MTRVLERLSCVALLSGAAFTQSTETPAFEAADVHVSINARRPLARGRPSVRGDRYEARNASMVDLIAAAYAIRPENVVGGPSWLELDRFDVIAKMRANASPEDQRAMLQALLADRFKLAVHKDTEPLPAFALTAGKHPTLKKSDGSNPSQCEFMDPPPPRPGEPFVPFTPIACTNMTMKAFADELVRMSPLLLRQPVVDQTELDGAWDFTFKYIMFPMNQSGTITIFDALEKQLGLKLYPARIPQTVVVVDRVNGKPTDNAPGVTGILHETPPPTEFEVASVKPSNPNKRDVYPLRIQPGGRVTMDDSSLKFLIEQAWNIPDDMLIGAPEWLNSETFDIVAKAPSGDVDQDTIWPMVRALLQDRFHLAVHFEDRVIPAYTLVSVKPKLKKADPNSRTRYQEGPLPDGKDPRITNPILSRLVTCQNMTMAQFAERLQSIASGYIRGPVLDATGLEGSYDFTLSFSRPGQVRRAGAGRGGDNPASAAIPQASDPNGAVSLFEAVEKQLGLKLELQKRKLPVLVIDHVDQKPTDN